MMLGSSQSFMSSASNSIDWKAMFMACVTTVPIGKTVLLESDEVTLIGPYFLSNRAWNTSGGDPGRPETIGKIAISFPNVTRLGVGSLGRCFEACGLVSVNLPELSSVVGGLNFGFYCGTEIDLPKLTNFTNHDFSYSSTLKTLNLPSVTSKSGSFFVYHDTALENVYIPKMTLSQLGGASYIAQQECNSAAVFHLADGDYDYQGNTL